MQINRKHLKHNAYFDNAATTWPKPEAVYRFTDRFFRSHGVNPGRSGSLLALEAEQMITATRRMLCDFFGFTGDPNRLIFTLNGTDSLNTAISGIIEPKDHLVTTRLEHNAVLRVVNHLERDKQVAVTQVSPNVAGFVEPADIRAALRPNTRAIVLNHASNVTGAVQPLKEIALIAKAAGVVLIVDAAQTAGVLPINMDELGISVLTFTGHKGLFGPMGVGGMIVAEGVNVRPLRFGGTGVNSQSQYQPEDYPYCLEAGTVSLPGIAGLHAAQLWFKELGEQLQQNLPHASESEAQPSNLSDHGKQCQLAQAHIHQTELVHLDRIEAKLREFESVTMLASNLNGACVSSSPESRVATLSFTVKDVPAQRIADQLDADHHIVVRAGLQCAPLVHVDANTVESGGTVRLSPGYFTDEEDMSQLLTALDDILE